MPAIGRSFIPSTATTNALGGYLWDTATSTPADLARGAAHFIEPLGDPGMPWPPDMQRRSFNLSYPGGPMTTTYEPLFTGTGGNVDVYTAVRGNVMGVDPALGQDALNAAQRAEIIRNQGFSGLGENKVFITPDWNQAKSLMAEVDPHGVFKGDPEKYIFKGSVPRDQLARGLVKNALGEWEAIVDPSQADKIYGTGGVQQTTTGKVIPTNRFFGYNIENLLGKSRAAKEALSDIPGIQTAKDLIANTGLGKYVEPWKQPLVKALGGFARFMPVVSGPLDVIAAVQHGKDAAEARERGDTIQAALSTMKAGLAGGSALPGIGIVPYLAELGIEGAEEVIDWLSPDEVKADEKGTVQDAIRESQRRGYLSGIRMTPFGPTEISEAPGVPFPESVEDLQRVPAEAEESWTDKALRTGRAIADWRGFIGEALPDIRAGRGIAPNIRDVLTGGILKEAFDEVDKFGQVESPEGFFPFVGDTGVGEYIEPEVITPEVRVQEYVSEGVDRGLAEALVDQKDTSTQEALKAEQDRKEQIDQWASIARIKLDNQIRADEAARVAETARQHREVQERQAEAARQEAEDRENRIREESRRAKEAQLQADDRKAIARAKADAERAGREAEEARERERQATIERKEADARQRATEIAEKKRDDLMQKQMADMMKSMEEARKRQEELNAQRLLSSFTAPARPTYSPRRFGPH